MHAHIHTHPHTPIGLTKNVLALHTLSCSSHLALRVK
uniref:Uncharacterized protein n=1 Tax=Anguilla anguilla TaxID=7936 RepID=A0A0E9RKJ2_ANGAN